VCTAGKKIGNSEVALLEKMNLKPFFYGMKVISAYDDGSVLGADIVSLSSNDLLGKFADGVRNLTALSLQTGIPSEVAVPHLILDAFKNLAAIGLAANIQFKQLSAASSGPAPSKAADKAPAKKEEKKPEPVKVEEPVEEEVDMGGLFD